MSVSFLLKLLALTCSFIKKEALAQVFSYDFCQRTPFWKNTSGRLLLYIVSTQSNTALSQEKTFQRLNIPYRVLYKDALTNNPVRVSGKRQPGKFPPIKLPPRKFPPGKFPPRKFPLGILPPMFLNIPTWVFKFSVFSLLSRSSLIFLKRLFSNSMF